jgi:microcystin-dependent protein
MYPIIGMTPQTAEKVKALINRVPTEGLGYTRSGPGKQVTHVSVSGEVESDGWYPCFPVAYNQSLDDFNYYSAGKVKDANGEALEVDRIYLAIRTGDIEGVAHYVAVATTTVSSASESEGDSSSTEYIEVTIPECIEALWEDVQLPDGRIPDAGADGTILVAADGEWTVVNSENWVSNTKLRDSAGLSVIGRSANTGGDPADITGTAGVRQVLSNNGTTLEWATGGFAPVGMISPYGGSSAPSGWLLCDGSAVSRTTYASLFAVLSTSFGAGNGSTTFNLPDMRGRVPMGVDGAANRVTSASTNGANADTLGGTGGAETHTLTTAQLPSHNHSIQGPLLKYVGTGGNRADLAAGSVWIGTDSSPTNTGNSGSGNAHSNTQPWQAVNYIIFAGV